MPRFFVRAEQIENETVTVLGDDAHHISRSLRMAVGERITVSDMQCYEYECELTEFLPDRVLAQVIEKKKCDTEPPYVATVLQALPKGDKLDSVIQKAVECGASEIQTFESERCIAKAKGENEDKRVERRQRIALEAAKQSGRGIVPAVLPTVSFAAALDAADRCDLPLFCYEGDGTEALPQVLGRFRETLAKDALPKIALMVGSEGGFSLNEAQRAKERGWIPVNLGKRILRTETAASFVLSCLVYELELAQKL